MTSKTFDVKEETHEMDISNELPKHETEANNVVNSEEETEAFFEEFSLNQETSPRLQYLRRKEAFLQKFLFLENWGRRGSKKRVLAIQAFLKFFEDVKKLVALNPILVGVETETVSLILSRKLPIPSDMISREKLIEKAFDNQNKCRIEAFSRIASAFKVERKMAFEFYEYAEYDRVDNLGDYKPDRPARPRHGFWSWTTEEQYFNQDQEIIDDRSDSEIVVENPPVKDSEEKMQLNKFFLRRLHRQILKRIRWQKPVDN